MIEIPFDDFSGGMNLRGPKGQLPKGQHRYIRNLESYSMSGKGLKVTAGPTTLFTPGYSVRSLTRYVNGSTRRLIVHKDNGDMLSQDESVGWAPSTIGTSSDADGARYALTPSGVLLWTNGTSGALQAWAGSGTATDAGMTAPTGTVTITETATGVVTGKGKANAYYQAMVTFVNARGVESQPGAASAVIYPSDSTIEIAYVAGSLSDIPSTATKVRFYLFGGDLGDFYYVGEDASITIPGSYPGNAATYTFNQQDSDVGTITLKRNVGPPPSGLDILCIRQSRLWAAKTGETNLYFSGYNAYEGFSTTSENDGQDGGVLALQGGTDDGLTALAAYATFLVVGRKRSVYTLYGNQSSNFALSKRADIGVASRDGVCVSPSGVYFAGSDFRVWKLTDDGPVRISEPIDSAWEGSADWSTVKLTWNSANNSIIVSLKVSSDGSDAATYMYYEQTGGWYQETDLYNQCIARVPKTSGTGDDVLFIPYNKATIKKAFADTATERTVYWQSVEFAHPEDAEAPRGLSMWEGVTLEGRIVNAPASSSNYIKINTIYEVRGTNTSTSYTASYAGLAFPMQIRTNRFLIGEWLLCSMSGKMYNGDYATRIAVNIDSYRRRF